MGFHNKSSSHWDILEKFSLGKERFHGLSCWSGRHTRLITFYANMPCHVPWYVMGYATGCHGKATGCHGIPRYVVAYSSMGCHGVLPCAMVPQTCHGTSWQLPGQNPIGLAMGFIVVYVVANRGKLSRHTYYSYALAPQQNNCHYYNNFPSQFSRRLPPW